MRCQHVAMHIGATEAALLGAAITAIAGPISAFWVQRTTRKRELDARTWEQSREVYHFVVATGGLNQVLVQPFSAHCTVRCPLPPCAASAAGQSQGCQPTITSPGPHGCPPGTAPGSPTSPAAARPRH